MSPKPLVKQLIAQIMNPTPINGFTLSESQFFHKNGSRRIFHSPWDKNPAENEPLDHTFGQGLSYAKNVWRKTLSFLVYSGTLSLLHFCTLFNCNILAEYPPTRAVYFLNLQFENATSKGGWGIFISQESNSHPIFPLSFGRIKLTLLIDTNESAKRVKRCVNPSLDWSMVGKTIGIYA